MTSIKVYNPLNSYTKNNRQYNVFFDKFTDLLHTKFNVIEDRFFEDAHKARYEVKLLSQDAPVLLYESEYLIENQETKEFIILNVLDDTLGCIVSVYSNPYFKKALTAQYHEWVINYHLKEYTYKCEPWTYFPMNGIDIESYYLQRTNTIPTNNKLYFKGTSLDDRTILNHINKDIINEEFSPSPHEIYFADLINTKLALSVDGRGEFCYRDVELMGIGVPFIRFEYINKLNPNLIPNYHYISISRPADMELYRMGSLAHAKLLENRYNEVITDDKLLQFVAANARKYYIDNLTLENQIVNTYKQLKVEDWE